MGDREWMARAIELAATAVDEVPVAALLVKDGQLLASALNRREENASPLHHAEMLVLEEGARLLHTRRLSGCTLYVTLEPCPMCAGALILSGIDRCVFAAFDKAYGCCGSLYALPLDARFTHRVELLGGLMEDEAAALLHRFFAEKRQSKET